MPPQAVEIEQAVLGAMLIDQRAIEQARDILVAGNFYHAAHGLIFAAMLHLYDTRVAVDQLTLAEELRRRDQLDQVGGVVYLAKIAAEVATWANVSYHAKIVLTKARMRRLIEVSSTITREAYEDAEDPLVLVERAEDALLSMVNERQDGALTAIAVALEEALEIIEKAHNARGALTGIDTGLQELNRLTGGWQNGDSIILAARPSVGKSALAFDFIRAAVAAGKSVGLFSLEMARHQVVQRLLAQAEGFDLQALRTGRLMEAEWVRLIHAAGKISTWPISIDDRSGLTILEVRSQCIRVKREKGLDLVVIDYLQLMAGHKRADSREQEVSQISRGIKGLAKELRIPVIALSQLNRALESRTDHRPKLSDLRETGSLEQDADVVMFLYRPDLYGIHQEEIDGVKVPCDGMVELSLGKQRNGPLGSVWLKFEAEQTRFAEHQFAPEWREEPEYYQFHDNR